MVNEVAGKYVLSSWVIDHGSSPEKPGANDCLAYVPATAMNYELLATNDPMAHEPMTNDQ
jgi:hypothetical protein